MTIISTPARTVITAPAGDRLSLLVVRIAAGDRAAFRDLYAFLALRVWREALRALPSPADARAVTRSTFVEVWHLARHHVGSRTDTRGWIGGIAARRAGERRHAPDPRCPILGDDDERVRRELAALLGPGRATIRTSSATFVRVDDLDLDLVARHGGEARDVGGRSRRR